MKKVSLQTSFYIKQSPEYVVHLSWVSVRAVIIHLSSELRLSERLETCFKLAVSQDSNH